MNEAILLVTVMLLGGLVGGHWLTAIYYRRRWRQGLRWQAMREERLKEMDAEDVAALDEIARRSGAV